MLRLCSRTLATVVILASLFVQACNSTASDTSKASNRRNVNKTGTPGNSPHCDPNYSGCVPIASDVDCAGGSGDGPAYVKGPVTVIGEDIYDLDRNGNGIGCE